MSNDEQIWRRACMAEACQQGRKECPVPLACRIPEKPLPLFAADDKASMAVAVVLVLAVAVVIGVIADEAFSGAVSRWVMAWI